MRTVLTISGSDCSGGSGIQGDVKVITGHGMFAMTAVTAMIACNCGGMFGIMPSTAQFVAEQIDCVFGEVYPDAVKIGLMMSAELIEVVADKLIQYGVKRVVLDPVLLSIVGSRMLEDEAIKAMCARILPLASVLTVTIPEAELLTGMQILGAEDMKNAAAKIGQAGGISVLVKGGCREKDANDLLYTNHHFTWFYGERIDTRNTYGAGNALSASIACNLAKGYPLETCIDYAKSYISGALKANRKLGKGTGPVDCCFHIGGYHAT
ncbi:MAG: bifunctional hydroxymethylpyrimidine kinase/phosphomethylpyrimidine kinase [Lachnospiraceae bacterium]|nr:bifunctional hydroxymethylpyrimidine kinase/phosphomethylpyrimidine kinase [Lachnospiraceae bacterium]